MELNKLSSLIKPSINKGFADFAIFYRKLQKNGTYIENILFFENTVKQRTRLTAHSTQYPTELGFTQTEFKYKEPTEIYLTGIISRKGTGAIGFNFGLSSLFSNFSNKKEIIKETRKDLEYLISNTILCEVYSLNGGTCQNMTLTSAEILDDNTHVGLFESDLSFKEVPPLILEEEPYSGAFKKKTSTGMCQCYSEDLKNA